MIIVYDACLRIEKKQIKKKLDAQTFVFANYYCDILILTELIFLQVSERYALLVAGKGARLRQLRAWLTAAGTAPGLLALDEAHRARRGSAAGAASLALQAPRNGLGG